MGSTRSPTMTTLSALATLVASPLVLAHHGPVTQPSLYLTDDLVELEGEIVNVLWRNPHLTGQRFLQRQTATTCYFR